MGRCPECVFAFSGCVVRWSSGVLNAPLDLAEVGTKVESMVSGPGGWPFLGRAAPGEWSDG